eukprot:scaffold20252_cov135-Isochrysis_galbana.AAC.4
MSVYYSCASVIYYMQYFYLLSIKRQARYDGDGRWATTLSTRHPEGAPRLAPAALRSHAATWPLSVRVFVVCMRARERESEEKMGEVVGVYRTV